MLDSKTPTEENTESELEEKARKPELFFDKKFFNQIKGPDGQTYLVEKTIDVDKLLSVSHRESKWKYSQYVANQICEEIANGASITALCKTVGFPPYSVVARWRRDNEDFNFALRMATADRAEYFRDQLQEILNTVENKNVKVSKLKSEIFKTLASYDDSKKFGKQYQRNDLAQPATINIVLPVDYSKQDDLSDLVEDMSTITNIKGSTANQD